MPLAAHRVHLDRHHGQPPSQSVRNTADGTSGRRNPGKSFYPFLRELRNGPGNQTQSR